MFGDNAKCVSVEVLARQAQAEGSAGGITLEHPERVPLLTHIVWGFSKVRLHVNSDYMCTGRSVGCVSEQAISDAFFIQNASAMQECYTCFTRMLWHGHQTCTACCSTKTAAVCRFLFVACLYWRCVCACYFQDFSMSGLRVGCLHTRNTLLSCAFDNISYFAAVSNQTQVRTLWRQFVSACTSSMTIEASRAGVGPSKSVWGLLIFPSAAVLPTALPSPLPQLLLYNTDTYIFAWGQISCNNMQA